MLKNKDSFCWSLLFQQHLLLETSGDLFIVYVRPECMAMTNNAEITVIIQPKYGVESPIQNLF